MAPSIRFQKTIRLLAWQNLGASGEFEHFLGFPGFLLAGHAQDHARGVVLDGLEARGIGAAERR